MRSIEKRRSVQTRVHWCKRNVDLSKRNVHLSKRNVHLSKSQRLNPKGQVK